MAKILIGVTGSIAAYKIIELTHLLRKQQHEVKVILTHAAESFVTATSFAAFGAEVYTDTANTATNTMQHIHLAKWPDMVIVAPLSANTLSKISHGFGDNLLTSTILATTAPVYLVPAMNMYMWQNSIIQDNIQKLKTHNYTFWGPRSGIQACRDIGDGRMLEAEEIATLITHVLLSKNKNMKGLNVVITLGATIEAIDPVRYISNHSSGKMGIALAYACASHGARVHVIAGNINIQHLDTLNIEHVSSAQEMLDASIRLSSNADIFIGCAAVSDYTVTNYPVQKIKKQAGQNQLQINLTQTADIIATIKQTYPTLFVVGFAAETDNLIEYAKAKLLAKDLNLIIANDVSKNKAFGSEENEVHIIDRDLDITHIELANKNIIAHEIIDTITDAYALSYSCML